MFDIFVDLRRISACIVHKNIYFSILFYYLIDHCLYFRTYGKVMGKGGGRTTPIFNHFYRLIKVCLGSGNGCDCRALCGDGKRSLPSDSLAGAGYNCNFSF